MRPTMLLTLLIGGAAGAGGLLQGMHWKKLGNNTADEDLKTRVAELQAEVDILQRENDQLRSLSQGGGELKVPRPLVEFVESSVGLEFKSSPVVHQIAGEELRERVAASIESRFPPNELSYRESAWKMMGLMAPDDSFTGQLAATYSTGARSWFDDQVGEGWVTHRYEENSVPDQGALIRALVRILLHQHHPPEVNYPGDEAYRSRNALHHGTALAVESRYLARQALSQGITGSAPPPEGTKELLEMLPAYVRGLANFPSKYGLPYADMHIARDELLEELHDTPRHTFEFNRDIEIEKPVAVELPEQDGELMIEESAGWLGLMLWLESVDPEMGKLANDWRGDRYRLIAGNDTSYDLIWEIEFASEKTAAEVAKIGCSIVGMLGDTEEDPDVGQTVTTPLGYKATIDQPAPNRVRLSNIGPRE